MEKGKEIIQRIISSPLNENMPNDLLREFQRGYPIGNLRLLMESKDENVCKSAVWIASELGDKSCIFLKEIIDFLDHRLKYIRFFAIDCVLSCSNFDNGEGAAKVFPLLEDLESSIRWKATHFLYRASFEHLKKGLHFYQTKIHDSRHITGIQFLMDANKLNKEDILVFLNSEISILRKYGVVAAAKNFEHTPELLRIATTSNDAEIREFAKEFYT